MITSVCFYDKDGNDISADVEKINIGANPFEWLRPDFYYKGKIIGYAEFGRIYITDKNFTYKEVEEDD